MEPNPPNRDSKEHTSSLDLKNSSEWMFGREKNKNSVLTKMVLCLLGTFRWTVLQIKGGNIEGVQLPRLTLQQENIQETPKLQLRHPISIPELFRSLSKTDQIRFMQLSKRLRFKSW